MVTLSIQISDEQAKRLAAMAERFHMTVEELAAAGLRELLAKPDDRFEEMMRQVLQKNADLYRRLV